MIVGTLSTVPVPSQRRLEIYTDQVARNNHYGDESVTDRSEGNPVPASVGGSSPIKHVIYIIKENRTYDQVFGDLKQGDGDPALTLFGAANTPNLHALAQRFGILDNFYADAEVSADGHNWATSANASDYNEKMWPQDYAPGVGRNRGYDFEGGSTVNLSAGGYLWDAALHAGVSLRDYGEFANNAPLSGAKLIPQSQADTCTGPVAGSYTGVTVPAGQVLCFGPTTTNATTTPALVGREDPKFHGYDLRYREADRVQEGRASTSSSSRRATCRGWRSCGCPTTTPPAPPRPPDPAGVRGRERPGGGQGRGCRQSQQGLGQHGDLHHRGRRPERPRPRGRAPDGVAGHQPLHAAEPALRRPHPLRHLGHAPDDGAAAGDAADEPVRRQRDAHVAPVPRGRQHAPLQRAAREPGHRDHEHRRHPRRPPSRRPGTSRRRTRPRWAS